MRASCGPCYGDTPLLMRMLNRSRWYRLAWGRWLEPGGGSHGLHWAGALGRRGALRERIARMRVLPAARHQRAHAALSSALQQYFRVPEDMPDAFVQAFARLDSSERRTEREESKPDNRSRAAMVAGQP
jgi:hypothetical protein